MDHPSREQLQRLLEGQLAQADVAAIDAHLQGCTPCRAVMDDLTRASYPNVMPRDTPEQAERAPDKNYPRWFEPAQRLAEVRRQGITDGGEEPPSPAGQSALVACPTIAGYEILGKLGRGGMGVVYKARQSGLNRLVALKMILAGEYTGPDDVARFRCEAEAAAQLQHPNIVQIYEYGEHDGRPFFAMELVDGGGLNEKLNGTPVPARQAAEILEVMARAVHVAHQRGILHRDLKPANVLLQRLATESTENTEGGPKPSSSPVAVLSVAHYLPKISDFGLAKRLTAEPGQTPSEAILGTPSYMAPEQAGDRAKKLGPPTDVYALGTILYEMLTGRPPFRGETDLDTLLQVRMDEPVPPSRLRLKLPRDLETICLMCLQKEPHKRYATAQALAEDLARFLAGKPILARPISAWERGLKWANRRRALAALIVVGVLVLASLGIGGPLLARHERQLRRLADEERQRADKAAHIASMERQRAEKTAALSLEAVDRLTDGFQDLLARTNRRLDENGLAVYRTIVILLEEITAASPPEPAPRKLLAKTLNNLAADLARADQTEEAEKVFQRAIDIYEGLVQAKWIPARKMIGLAVETGYAQHLPWSVKAVSERQACDPTLGLFRSPRSRK